MVLDGPREACDRRQKGFVLPGIAAAEREILKVAVVVANLGERLGGRHIAETNRSTLSARQYPTYSKKGPGQLPAPRDRTPITSRLRPRFPAIADPRLRSDPPP
jgi:hypothetical protein